MKKEILIKHETTNSYLVVAGTSILIHKGNIDESRSGFVLWNRRTNDCFNEKNECVGKVILIDGGLQLNIT